MLYYSSKKTYLLFLCFVLFDAFGIIFAGKQPESGASMKISANGMFLPGHMTDSNGTIIVKYNFNDGTQGPEHPNPGQPYWALSFPRTAYFPNNTDGIKVVG